MIVLAAVILGGIVGAVTTRRGKTKRRSPRLAAPSTLEDKEQNNDDEEVEFEVDNTNPEPLQAQKKRKKKKKAKQQAGVRLCHFE